jgi:predicted transcriptional regulator with HTH domain
VSELRRKLCFYFYRELGIPLAEIARQVRVGTTGVAMALEETNMKK